MNPFEKDILYLYDEYTIQTKKVPEYAYCKIKYKDDPTHEYDSIIKLSLEVDEYDNKIIFYVHGLKGLFYLLEVKEDFVLLKVYGFANYLY